MPILESVEAFTGILYCMDKMPEPNMDWSTPTDVELDAIAAKSERIRARWHEAWNAGPQPGAPEAVALGCVCLPRIREPLRCPVHGMDAFNARQQA